MSLRRCVGSVFGLPALYSIAAVDDCDVEAIILTAGLSISQACWLCSDNREADGSF